MAEPKQPVQPLGISVSREVLDWDHVEPRHVEIGKDVLGLSPQDRQALGLSAPRNSELEAPTLGGAEMALAEVLARGGALGAPKNRHEPYMPSTAVGRSERDERLK